jgi:lysophospholipase L1-like esterase
MDEGAPAQPPTRRALVFGDSMVDGVDLGPGWKTHVECRPGATSEQLADDGDAFGLGFLLAEDRYDAVVLSAGTNDPWHQALTDAFINRLCAQVTRPIRLVVVRPRHNAPAPSSTFATVHLATFDDGLFKVDRVHLNGEGIITLSAHIRATLENVD